MISLVSDASTNGEFEKENQIFNNLASSMEQPWTDYTPVDYADLFKKHGIVKDKEEDMTYLKKKTGLIESVIIDNEKIKPGRMNSQSDIESDIKLKVTQVDQLNADLLLIESIIPTTREAKPYKTKGKSLKKNAMKEMSKRFIQLDGITEEKEDYEKFYKLKGTVRAHLDSINGIALHPKEFISATASDDGTVKLFDLQVYTERKYVEYNFVWMIERAPQDLKPLFTYRGHNGPVIGVDFSSDGDSLFTSGKDGLIHMYKTQTIKNDEFLPYGKSNLQ